MPPEASPNPDDRSVAELVSQLSEQTSHLVRAEMRLARAEMSEKAKHAGVGLGSVAPRAIRSHSAETVLVGRAATPESLAEAASRSADDARPIDDLRASAEYRRAMVPVLVRRALDRSLDRARAQGSGP